MPAKTNTGKWMGAKRVNDLRPKPPTDDPPRTLKKLLHALNNDLSTLRRNH